METATPQSSVVLAQLGLSCCSVTAAPVKPPVWAAAIAFCVLAVASTDLLTSLSTSRELPMSVWLLPVSGPVFLPTGSNRQPMQSPVKRAECSRILGLCQAFSFCMTSAFQTLCICKNSLFGSVSLEQRRAKKVTF